MPLEQSQSKKKMMPSQFDNKSLKDYKISADDTTSKSSSSSLNALENTKEELKKTQQKLKYTIAQLHQGKEREEALWNRLQDVIDLKKMCYQNYIDTKSKLEQTQQSLKESAEREEHLKEEVQVWARQCKELRQAVSRKEQQQHASSVSSVVSEETPLELAKPSCTDSIGMASNEEVVDTERLMNEKKTEEIRRIVGSDGSDDNSGWSAHAASDGDDNVSEGISRSQSTSSSQKGLKTYASFESDQRWEAMFATLQEYKKQYGQAHLPCHGHDVQLRNWVSKQRRLYFSNRLCDVKIKRLESIGFKWQVAKKDITVGTVQRKQKWDDMLKKLEVYKEQHGQAHVPRKYHDISLVNWVCTQRRQYFSNKLSDERRKRLESIGFKWRMQRGKLNVDRTQRNKKWDAMFEQLTKHKEIYGYAHVSCNQHNSKLRSWEYHQRTLYHSNLLEDDRIKRLESIGFKWRT